MELKYPENIKEIINDNSSVQPRKIARDLKFRI